MASYSRSSSPAETVFSVDYDYEELSDSQHMNEQAISPRMASLLPVADLSADHDRLAQNQERSAVSQVLPTVLADIESPLSTSLRNQPIQNQRSPSASVSLTRPLRRNPPRQARRVSPIMTSQRKSISPSKITSVLRRVYPTTSNSTNEEQDLRTGATPQDMEFISRKTEVGTTGEILMGEELRRIRSTSSSHNQEDIP